MEQQQFNIPTITIDEEFISIFSEESHEQITMGGMMLTNRINAQNLRLRESKPGYVSNFHVAGDPTLIIVQQGTLRITLQNGESKDFSSGDLFIAKDYLLDSIDFDPTIHGHKAEVFGNKLFKAVHVKLSH